MNSNNNLKKGSNKSFGIVFSIVFFLISFWPLLNNNEIRVWALIVAIIFLILGILKSKFLTPLNTVWFKFGLFLGSIMSPIIMGIIFFAVVTPTSIIMKFFRKDLLLTKYDKNLKSYWIKRNKSNTTMKQQF
jgi:hypothetical protein